METVMPLIIKKIKKPKNATMIKLSIKPLPARVTVAKVEKISNIHLYRKKNINAPPTTATSLRNRFLTGPLVKPLIRINNFTYVLIGW